MLQLNDSASVKKAATGPNVANRSAQTAKNTTGYNEQKAGLPTAVNQGVNSTGPTSPVGPSGIPQPAAKPATYDYQTDPILQIIIGQQELAIQSAQAAAMAQQKQALIAYGDPSLALSVLGDQTTADAAMNNPYSTLATMAASNKQTVRGVNEAENKSNLFYSSDRGYQLGLAQQAYLQNQSQASGDLQKNLTGIGAQLLASEQSAWNAEASAQQDAYNRAITAAMNNQLGTPAAVGGGGSGGGGDNGVPTGPGFSTAAAGPKVGAGVDTTPKPGYATTSSPGKTNQGYKAGGAIRT